MTPYLPILLGAMAPFGVALLLWGLLRAIAVEVEDEEAVLVERFGKLRDTLRKPGLHGLPSKLLPWVNLRRVSLRRDFLQITEVHVADREGTTVIVDVWIDYRIADPVKAQYAVEHLHESLRSLVMHSTLSLLGRRTFHEILCDRSELGELLKQDIQPDTERWGIAVELAFIQKVSLLPEVSTQILSTISARLGRARSELQEVGRLAVAGIEAETSVKVAGLLAEAKSQYPLAIGRAMAELGEQPKVLAAYHELYRLSLLRPHRATAFIGFEQEGMRAVDVAMLPQPPK